MSKSTRLFLSLSEEEFQSFENARNELGYNRSQYIRYLIGGQKEIRPPAMKYQEIIARMASIDRSLKVIAMKDVLSDTDRMFIVTKLEELKKMLGHNRT
ncbi:MAG: hypothetical protein U0L79_05850 [Lachnospiraceae bacterium]|nr:hypothetical protein [Lachnospiraceae bacterium]